MKNYSRRKFIDFIGKGTLTGVTLSSFPFINSCNTSEKIQQSHIEFKGLKMAEKIDDVILAEGFEYKLLASFEDGISDKDYFGAHNDYLAFFPSKDSKGEGILWVNNEYYSTTLMQTRVQNKTQEMVDKERYVVGGTIVKIKKGENNTWSIVKNDPINKRITGATKIPFLWNEKIAGSHVAEGTLQNCSGGVTPWGTILTCEENYDSQYGEVYYDENGTKTSVNGLYQWEKYYDNPPEHYGWVVEVNIETGDAQKIVAMGRCKHECATVHQLPDGRVVIYSGDDEDNRCIYKYVSENPRDLENGTLYVADVENGNWISLKYEDQQILRDNFKDQTEVLVRLREASILVGGSKMNRPEDIEIDPITGGVFIALTNNKSLGDYHGSILKIMEDSDDKTGTSFSSETYLTGGNDTLFSSPDNLAFDKKGNLWFCTDISAWSLGKTEYANFVSNRLFMVPRSGERAGEVIQIASAPNDAEFTGICFHPNEATMFLSVQHPGESSESINALTSHWPLGRNSIPKSSVVSISGKSLKEILK